MVIRCKVFSVKTNGTCFETDCQPLVEEDAAKGEGVKKTYPVGKVVIGVKDLKEESTAYKSRKKTKVHPLGPQERIEQDVNKEVESVSPFLKKGNKDGDGKKLEKKKDERTTDNRTTQDEPPAVTTIILKITLHCEGCGLKIRRTIDKIKGVQKVEIDQQNEQIVVVGNMDVDSIANHLMEKFKTSVQIVPQEIIHDRDSNNTENILGGTVKQETNDIGIKKKEKNSDLKRKTEGTDKEVNNDCKKKEGDIRDVGNKKGEQYDKVDVNREANANISCQDMKEQNRNRDKSTNKIDHIKPQKWVGQNVTTEEDRSDKGVEDKPERGIYVKMRNEKRNADKKRNKEEPPAVTTVFKIKLHCEGCKKKICQLISKIEGVQNVEAELENDLVRVVGNIDVNSIPECLREKNFACSLLEIIHKGESSLIKQQENNGADGEKKESGDNGLKDERSSERKKNNCGGKKKENGNYIGEENKDTETKEDNVDGRRKERKKIDVSSETKEDGKVDTRFTAEHRGENYRYPHSEMQPPMGENPFNMFNDENANSCSIM